MTPTTDRKVPHIQFPPATVAALREQLNAAGDGAKLAVYMHGVGDLHLQVIPLYPDGKKFDVDECPPALNDSFICPGSPRC